VTDTDRLAEQIDAHAGVLDDGRVQVSGFDIGVQAPVGGGDDRIVGCHGGRLDDAFTMRQYVETDLEADREVASILAELIIGGSLASVEIDGDQDGIEPQPAADKGDEDPAA
jgi:hypothetical protein